MRKMKYWVLGLAMSVSLLVGACGQAPATGTSAAVKETTEAVTESVTVEAVQTPKAAAAQTGNSGAFDLSAIPAYSGQPYVAVNNNVPFFSDADLTDVSFESYGDLDALGRCSVAYASVGTDTMPTEKRGNIGQVKPTGWHTVKYDFVDGKYLYNRCHLIGYQLTAENANEKNLITGTRYLNVQGMLPFENMTADYVKETENHVLYRVTPVFEGNNLVAAGVLMEAESVEDKGEGVEFCVFVYNAQPGVTIDYATGDSWHFCVITESPIRRIITFITIDCHRIIKNQIISPIRQVQRSGNIPSVRSLHHSDDLIIGHGHHGPQNLRIPQFHAQVMFMAHSCT